MSVLEILAIISSISTQQGLPEGLLESVCYKESAFNIKAINYYDGKTHSYGICQVKLETAKTLGFKGSSDDLQEAETNITYAAKYLNFQYRRYGRWDKAISAYNRGSIKSGCTHYSHDVIDIWMNKKYLN